MYRALVHGGDEVGKLTGPDRMMSQVTPDDFRREKRIDGLRIHGSLQDLFFTASIYEMEKHLKQKTPRHHHSVACYFGPILALGAVIIVRNQSVALQEYRDLGG